MFRSFMICSISLEFIITIQLARKFILNSLSDFKWICTCTFLVDLIRKLMTLILIWFYLVIYEGILLDRFLIFFVGRFFVFVLILIRTILLIKLTITQPIIHIFPWHSCLIYFRNLNLKGIITKILINIIYWKNAILIVKINMIYN